MPRISQSQLAKLFQRLAISYKAGIDVRTILRKEAETGSKYYRSKSREVAEGVAEGKSLAEAMQETDGYFPELAISVVHAGEKGGRLEESFARLADHYRNLVSFRNRMLSSLAWPLFELFVAILMVGLMMAVCDWIFSALEKPPVNWFWMGSTFGNIVAYFLLVILFFIGLFLLLRGISQGWFGDLPMKIARRIPVVGKTIESLALSRFAWTISVAENAGMNPMEVASLALRSTENYYYQQHEDSIIGSLEKGKSYYKSFKATQAFPDDLLNQIDNGEISGELAETMNRASEEFQNRADLNLKLLGTIGFALMLGLVALLVLGVAVFAMQQYLELLSGISKW
jgi:type II secretory pathway component PulF